VVIERDEFVAKYNQLRTEQRLPVPAAAGYSVPYVSRHGIAERPSVLFSESTRSQEPKFELCLRFEADVGQTVVRPLLILDVPKPAPGIGVFDHASRVRDCYLRLQDRDCLRVQIQLVLDVSVQALRRLLTAEMGRMKSTHG
jgi:hypothetical protein